MMRSIHLGLLAALVAGAVLATPAHALYIQTPLLLFGPEAADAGDDVRFDIRPDNATAASRFAGKTGQIVYGFDPAESDDPPASDGRREADAGTVTLDDEGRGSFLWTVPEEVQDHNVDLALVIDGERVAFAFIAIGDAPPAMHILAASGPGIEPGQSHDEAGSDAPGFGALAGLGVVALALVLRRK